LNPRHTERAMTMKHHTLTLMRTLVLAAAGLLPMAVHAHHIGDVCTRSDGLSINQVVKIKITTTLGRNVQDGEAYGPWVAYPLTWTCTRTPSHKKHHIAPDYFEGKTEVYPYGVTPLDLPLPVSDKTWTVGPKRSRPSMPMVSVCPMR